MLKKTAFAWSLTAAAALLPGTAWGQATVITIAEGTLALDQTAKAVRVRLGSFETQPLKKSDAVSVGDELRSESGGVEVELLCAGGSRITLSGKFRVIVSLTLGRDCTVNLLSGKAHFVSEPGTGGTAGQAGVISFSSESTWFEVSVTREGETLRQEVNVYEGTVTTASPTRRQKLNARNKGKLVIAAGTWQVTHVTAEDKSRTARLYTNVSLSKVPPPLLADSKATYADLYDAYTAVLAEPNRPEVRVRLGSTQLRYSLTSEALGRLAPEKIKGNPFAQAFATLLRQDAYEKMGVSP